MDRGDRRQRPHLSARHHRLPRPSADHQPGRRPRPAGAARLCERRGGARALRRGELQRRLHRQSRICARQPTASPIRRWSRRRRSTTIIPPTSRLEMRKVQEIPSGYDSDAICHRADDDPRARRQARSRSRSLRRKDFAQGRLGQAVPLRLWRLRLSPSRRASRPAASAWSTAASPSPSPISAAATTLATNGSSTASSSKRTNTFNDFVDVARGLIAEGYAKAGPDRGAGRLGRRRADGRGRSTRRPSCGARSSPTCRSSTSSTPCSTTRCR